MVRSTFMYCLKLRQRLEVISRNSPLQSRTLEGKRGKLTIFESVRDKLSKFLFYFHLAFIFLKFILG